MKPNRIACLILFLTMSLIAPAMAKDVTYTCEDGTRLTASFSPPSFAHGSVKLLFAASGSSLTLPQAVSADGGRYAQGDSEFWIKGQGATLSRTGTSTTCQAD